MLPDLDTIKGILSKPELDGKERAFIKENIKYINWYLYQQEIEKIYGYKDIVHSDDIDRSKSKG